MILYQDTDSICKRYLNDEAGQAEIRTALERADVMATSWIAFAEVRAALAAAYRARRFKSEDDFSRAKADFASDWETYYRLPVSTELIRVAGDLAEQHRLKGYDAVHLAAAEALASVFPELVEVSTWDIDLRKAAVNIGLVAAHEVTT